MKGYILLISILFSIKLSSQHDQTALVVDYVFIPNLQTLDVSKNAGKMEGDLMSTAFQKLTHPENYPTAHLIVNGNHSYFKKRDKVESYDFSGRFAHIIASSNHDYLHRNGNCWTIKAENGANLFIQDPTDRFEWNLEPNGDKKEYEFGTFTVFQATGNYYHSGKALSEDSKKNISVVYTPEIPIPFGPVGIANLPGLCLEYELSGIGTWIVADIRSVPLEEIEVDWEVQGQKITRAEYVQLLAERSAKRQKSN